MQYKIIFSVFLLLFIQNLQAQTIINTSAKNDAIDDLRSALSGYNVGVITITQTPLSNRTGQEFYLAIQDNKIEIKYSTINSLYNSVYTLLDMWGFKWYGPTENWYVKPSTISVKNVAGKWIKPTFRNRSSFGTGGLEQDPAYGFDKNNTYKTDIINWKRRLRLSTDYACSGHSGATFYTENKAVLDNNADWFANTTGKYYGRLNIEKKDAVSVYKNWTKTYFAREKKNDFISINVEPEDGRGGADDPLPKNMAGIKSHSDKWWWLANEVAKEYVAEPKVKVTAYAYGSGAYNALVPNFKLLPNVYPVIIPYSFQTAYTPEVMVKKWAAATTGTMGIYDYWNITQWSLGAPQFNLYSIKKKLDFWANNKIDGVFLESTDGAGPMGHVLWLSAQLMFNNSTNFDKLYSQYLTDCFGAAAPDIKKVYDRWSNKYNDQMEPALFIKDLKNASTKVPKNSAAYKRILDLKAYAHFLRLKVEYNNTEASRRKLVEYIFQIHHLRLVQTAAIIGQSYFGNLPADELKRLLANTKPISYDAIENNFTTDAAEYNTVYNAVDFSFDFDKINFIEPAPTNAWRFGIFTNFMFKASYTGKLNLTLGAEKQTADFTIKNTTEELYKITLGKANAEFEETIDGRIWYSKNVSINIKKGEMYYISGTFGFNRVVIKDNKTVLVKQPWSEDFDNYAYPKQYFYVPKNATEIVYTDIGPIGSFFTAPSGTKTKPETTNYKDVYRVAVKPEDRGKIWIANFNNPVWKFINIPNYTSLQNFGYKE